MHDIDRAQVEAVGEMESYEMENYPLYSETPELGEAEEMELAAELMELESEEEFEEFLGSIVGALGNVVKSATGSSLTGLLKNILPAAATAVGGFFGGPAGASIAGKIGSGIAGSLEMEGSEMESDEMEWEAAKTFVRVAADAARNAAMAPEGQDPHATAHQAVMDAVQRHAPELAHAVPPPYAQPAGPSPYTQPGMAPPEHPGGCHCGGGHGHPHHGGHWVRRGHKIILYGV